MVSKNCLQHLRLLATGMHNPSPVHEVVKASASKFGRRSLATVSDVPSQDLQSVAIAPATISRTHNPEAQVTTTVYEFPRMEPLRFAYYSESHLYLPLRKDILHRAVVYEGDKTRLGLASTLWRNEVHGSHKKLYPQKGLGKARVGDKQSPIRRGGGVAFGPKPRDFATKLPQKIYDLAWRTALSYRYRRGQLIVVDRIDSPEICESWWLRQIFIKNSWGNANGRSLLITKSKNKQNKDLFEAMEKIGNHGRILNTEDVDVKDLLSMGRLVVEQRALHEILKNHSSDLFGSMNQANLNTVPELLKEM